MVYYIFAGLVYACILAILLLALIYGLRARRYVKHEEVTALARGFSPLDVQRIFIGKTYPRRLTRALIVYWAQMGYIRVQQVNRTHVRLTLVKKPSTHSAKDAVFFDRGTYVRERDLFNRLFGSVLNTRVININRPMFKKSVIKEINSRYAVREDEGVYSPKHYKLKVLTFVLSILPYVCAGAYLCVAESSGIILGVLCPLMMFLGMYFFRFMRDIPLLFRFVWSSFWVFLSVGLLIVAFQEVSDPFGLCYSAVAILFIGTFLLVRFVDYREKNNLADYSDLVNYRKYLLFSKKKDLFKADYYAALPFLYAFNIKSLVKRKFNTSELPEWFSSENGGRGWLL